MMPDTEHYQVRAPLFDQESLRLPILCFSLGYLAGKGPDEAREIKRRGYHMLGWVEEGNLKAVAAAQEHELTAGQALVLPADAVTGFLVRAPCRRYILKFRGTAVPAILKEFGMQEGQVLSVGAPPFAVFDRVRRALMDVSPVGAMQASVGAYEILARVSRQRHRPSRHPLVAQALAVIERDWSDPALNVKALAQRLGVHRTLLAQHFKADVGLSPGASLRRCRIREALSMLESTELRIAEIGKRCGYPDATQFARLIRKAAGISPRQVRLAR